MKFLESVPVQIGLLLITAALVAFLWIKDDPTYVLYYPTDNHGDIVYYDDARLLTAEFSQESSKISLWVAYDLGDNAITALVNGGAVVRSEEYLRSGKYLESRTVIELDLIIPAGVSAPLQEEDVTYSVYPNGCTYVQYDQSEGRFLSKVYTGYTVCSTACGVCEVERKESKKFLGLPPYYNLEALKDATSVK